MQDHDSTPLHRPSMLTQHFMFVVANAWISNTHRGDL